MHNFKVLTTETHNTNLYNMLYGQVLLGSHHTREMKIQAHPYKWFTFYLGKTIHMKRKTFNGDILVLHLYGLPNCTNFMNKIAS